MDTHYLHDFEPGHESPRRAVAANLNRWTGLRYDWRSQIVITAGGEALMTMLEAIVRPGDDVLTIVPSDIAVRRPWHRRTKAVVMPWLAAVRPPVWASIAVACMRADAWLMLDVCGMSTDQPAGSHPAALPGMARRTITVGSLCGGQLGWIAGPKPVIAMIARIRSAQEGVLPVAS
jgi:aspartate/methionine/tyrosine aminotransferase